MDLETGADFEHSQSLVRRSTETDLLLDEDQTVKKPFYRPRPLWLVPFAFVAAVTRGMTVAPRVEIFTQLACSRVHGNTLYNHTNIMNPPFNFDSSPTLSSVYSTSTLDPLGPHLDPQYLPQSIYYDSNSHSNKDSQEDDPRRLPSPQCLGDPAVQAGAAQLQTIMATTAGFLSALTTGYWGRFSERHGRTKVLAITTFGLFLTDLTFILVSTPTSPLSSHGHKFLLLAPIIEGSLGGWSALQSAAASYLSDCTSNGSRALIFSRFSGVYSFGLALGPSLGGYLIRNPIWATGQADGTPTVTSVFWVAIWAAFINFILVLFVFPESIEKARRAQNAAEQAAQASAKGKGVARESVDGSPSSPEQVATGAADGVVGQLLRPLRIFLPATIYENGRRYNDYSLMFLGLSFFIYMLSQGVYQVKYLYATHTYEWGAEQLSYYISFMGGIKTIFLLFFIPWVIAAFKPKPKFKSQAISSREANPKPTKPKPTRTSIVQDIKFDLRLAKLSFLVEILSHALVVLSPLPIYHAHGHKKQSMSWHSKQASQACFVFATSFATLSGGSLPAIHSLALSILQLRSLSSDSTQSSGKEGTGELFGALAVIGALGSGIIAPILFGLIYSGTVAAFPRSIFVAGAAFVVVSLALLMCVRAPGTQAMGKNSKGKKRALLDPERGRSRISKDLRGGASMNYGSIAGPSTSTSP